MQRTLIMQAGDIITAGDLQFEALHCLSDTEVDEQDGLVSESLGGDLKVQEKHMILNALQQSAGSRKTAAEQLGISPRTLRYKIARMREDGVAIPTAS